MAGVTLLGLKRRLKTVTNTRKITKAMGLVATSKYQRVRTLLHSNDEHFKALEEVVAQITRGMEEKESIYFKNKNRNKKLYVLLNSNKGMVGGYNSSVMTEALIDMQKQLDVPYIITTGNRGMGYLKKIALDDHHSEIIPIDDIPEPENLSELYDHMYGLYKNGFVDEIIIVFTKFVNPVRTEVVKESFLPLREDLFSKYEGDSTNFEYEPDAEVMQETVFNLYLKERLYNILLNAKTAEQSTRMRAMDSATKNADEILLALNKEFNRLRQSVITQEISEIVGGAEALK